MSGGVDSSVTALLLHQSGYSVSGLFMKNWEDYPDRPCPAAQDAQDALSVCDHLGIEMDAENFSQQYWDNVFTHFLDELKRGRTPNPDVLCNREIKFKVFFDYALAQGADFIATGHYARIDEQQGRWRLLKARDVNKDQTYFLYTLGQTQLQKTLFPIGHLVKPEVRKIAEEAGLSTSGKKDSTGVCFIGEKNFKKFLSRYVGTQSGLIRSVDGARVGQHDGLMFYTRGQRQGLHIGGTAKSSGEPWYVVKKDLDTNTLIVAQGHDHPALYTNTLRAHQLHWIAGHAPGSAFRCYAKTRYRQIEQSCAVTISDNHEAVVSFDQPQWAVTPGQSVVFYLGEECLGGGIIDAIENGICLNHTSSADCHAHAAFQS